MIRQSTIRRRAEEMLDELGWRELEVVLKPAPDPCHGGHMIRTVGNQNPEWYQRLCDQYQKRRGIYRGRCAQCGLRHDTRKGRKEKRCGKQSRRHWRPSFKSDTSIRRADVIRGLKELMNGECKSEYAKRLRDVIVLEWENNKSARLHRKIMANYLESVGGF